MHFSAEELRDYYQKKDFSYEFSLLSHPSWRHFRFALRDGSFLKIKGRVKHCKDLKRLLLRILPLDVYYSSSCYLNPDEVTVRSEKSKYKGIVLYNDIVFDVDASPVSKVSLESARKTAQALYKHLKDRKSLLKYIAFSGSKGFHIVCEDPDQYDERDPLKREKMIIASRKKLVSEIAQAGIKIDTAITVDTRRIIRLPGTINSKTGYAATVLDPEDLGLTIDVLLKKIPHIGKSNIPFFNIMHYLPEIKLFGGSDEKKIRSYFATYISSSVLGVKNRHTPFIEFRHISKDRALQRFNEIFATGALPNLIIFRTSDGYVGTSTISLQKNELLRLLRKAGSMNRKFFEKYKHNLLQLDLSPHEAKPSSQIKKPVAVYEREHGKKVFFSRGHHAFFSKICELKAQEKLHGDEDVKLIYTKQSA